MPRGCLRARIPSASRPSRAVGARRYSSSASSPSMRRPARIFSAIDSITIDDGSLELVAKTWRDRFADHAGFRRVAIKRLEAGAFLAAEIVLDIIPQVGSADLLVCARVGEIVPRDL